MNSKTIIRIGFISNYALRQILISAFNMVIPFMVIHFSSKETWGSFVPMLLFALLAMQIINWGNKEYMVRQFSRTPNKIGLQYSQNLATRFPLFVAAGLIGFIWFPMSFGFFMLAWMLGRFLIHSTEALVVYEKKFNASMAIEIAGFILFCAAFFCLKINLDLLSLLMIYSLYQLAKGTAYFILFSNFFFAISLKPEWAYYKSAFPFFLLSILGFLASKVDVYAMAHFGSKTTVGDYQIINSLLVFIMSLPVFIYAPFTKNIYRSNEAFVNKTGKFVTLAGLILIPVSLAAVYFILKFYLTLQLPLLFYFVAFAYVFPSFAYGIDILNLFRLQKEKTVVVCLFVGAFANAVLSALFLYLGYGIVGALTGSAIAQAIALILFKSRLRFEK
ncbi:MAG TPA: hypothetical protein VK623_08700 [Flavobacterium sp.]|nr:hypothetical protein [Flavobacterium sp.]